MAKKEFKTLTKEELQGLSKEDRISYYQAQDAHYGVKEGLFRVTRMSRHQDKHFENGDAASFGYNVVPAGKSVDTNDFAPNKFVWVNQLINKNTGAKVIDAMTDLQNDLAKKDTKSVLVSMKYKVSKDGYINVNAMYRRENNTAKANTTSEKDENSSVKDTNMPF